MLYSSSRTVLRRSVNNDALTAAKELSLRHRDVMFLFAVPKNKDVKFPELAAVCDEDTNDTAAEKLSDEYNNILEATVDIWPKSYSGVVMLIRERYDRLELRDNDYTIFYVRGGEFYESLNI